MTMRNKPYKLKVKDLQGHRIWAFKTATGHTTACKVEGCSDVPRHVGRGAK